MVVGQDGSSPWPIGDYFARLRREPAAINVLTAVGHATVRELVMGEDFKRAARPDEVTRMEVLVEQGMREGAVALSTGLEYDVGGFATTDEVVALARVAARFGGFYISHIRDEADKAFEAMREVVTIAEQARLPVQNTHIKLGTVGVWRRAKEALALYEAARAKGLDVTADAYPYDAWSSTITVLVPSRRLDDPAAVGKGLADVGGAANVLITRHAARPDYEFKTLAAVAKEQGITPVELFMQIVKAGGASVVCTSMVDEDIRAFYRWPYTMVSSDGGIGMRHPRGAGTFPRVLGRFVRERKWLTLEEAVRKMTSLPATRLKLTDRGVVRPGAWADLVLFDRATVIDRSTFDEPATLSTGIRQVWVNGTLVWEEPRTTGARPGQVISGQASRGASGKPRARDLGVPFDGTAGPLNAITDVAGVEVGVSTIVAGEGALVRGKGPVRTGVTAVLPRGRSGDNVFAGWHTLNGNGEMTGTTWITESGFLEGPILITNTHSVGVARDTTVEWMARYSDIVPLPVAAETYDGTLNDILGFHVKGEHVLAALDGARSGPVAEGNVGGGTGMIAFGFKGGTGTASRVVTAGGAAYTVGALVQANFGRRPQFLVAGVPVGREIADLMPETGRPPASGRQRRSRVGIDHRRDCHQRPAAPASVAAAGTARWPRGGAGGRQWWQRLRRYFCRVLHGQSRRVQGTSHHRSDDALQRRNRSAVSSIDTGHGRGHHQCPHRRRNDDGTRWQSRTRVAARSVARRSAEVQPAAVGGGKAGQSPFSLDSDFRHGLLGAKALPAALISLDARRSSGPPVKPQPDHDRPRHAGAHLELEHDDVRHLVARQERCHHPTDGDDRAPRSGDPLGHASRVERHSARNMYTNGTRLMTTVALSSTW